MKKAVVGLIVGLFAVALIGGASILSTNDGYGFTVFNATTINANTVAAALFPNAAKFTESLNITKNSNGEYIPLELTNEDTGTDDNTCIRIRAANLYNGTMLCAEAPGGLDNDLHIYLTNVRGRVEVAKFDADGHLGVNETSPTYTLDVDGTIHSTAAATFGTSVSVGTDLTVTNNVKVTKLVNITGNSGQLVTGPNGPVFFQNSTCNIWYYVNGSESIRSCHT